MDKLTSQHTVYCDCILKQLRKLCISAHRQLIENLSTEEHERKGRKYQTREKQEAIQVATLLTPHKKECNGERRE